MCLIKSSGIIVALRNEKGSYNRPMATATRESIVALRNEKGSYNLSRNRLSCLTIVALRNEKGSYNPRTQNRT